MLPKRPDLSQVNPEVLAYIQDLEALIDYQLTNSKNQTLNDDHPQSFPSEPPGTAQVITISKHGFAKRTPRHLYSKQHRGGMGIFDLELPPDDTPGILLIAEPEDMLIIFSSNARAFRVPVSSIQEGQIRSRGQSITTKMQLASDEELIAALPFLPKGAAVLVGENGMVRHLRYHIFGEHMKQGINLFPSNQFGRLVAVCQTSGDADLFIATQQGRGVRFPEKLIPPQGTLGMKVDPEDRVVSITSVQQDDGVLLVDADGKGSIRLMSGFAANKSTGGMGKIAMNTSHLVGAQSIYSRTEALLISRLSKLIRFELDEIPTKESPVQGVNIMSLRADEVAVITVT